MSANTSPTTAQTGERPSADRVIIFDTTLRDGEQSPGASMTLEEKLRIAEVLEEMGVDVIEAGFPISSQRRFRGGAARSPSSSRRAAVCGLARAGRKDIDRAGEALQAGAARPRIHTFISTSPLHMKYKLQMEPDAVHRGDHRQRHPRPQLHRRRANGRRRTPSRTEHDFLCRCVESRDQGRRHARSTSPTRSAMPCREEFADAHHACCATACPTSTRRSSPPIATTIWAWRWPIRWPRVLAGARQVECTINGLGERAGNAALEEIVMALTTRQDLMPFTTGINTDDASPRASQLVSTITGFAVQSNKAIVGNNAFAHESGIHQDGMLKNAEHLRDHDGPKIVGLNAHHAGAGQAFRPPRLPRRS